MGKSPREQERWGELEAGAGSPNCQARGAALALLTTVLAPLQGLGTFP